MWGRGYPREVARSEKVKLGQVGTLAHGRGAGPDGRGRGRAGLGPGGRAGPRGTGRGQTAGGGAFRDLGRAEGRGRRVRARSRRAPSRPPCWLVCGCQTELEAAATLRAPVAPASSALLAAAVAHPGRPGGAQVSRGLGARGPERTEGADPAPPQSAPRKQLPPPPPRVCTPQSQPGLHLRRDPLLPNRPRPTGWSTAPPRLGPHSSAGTPPPNHRLPLRELFLRYPRSTGLPAPAAAPGARPGLAVHLSSGPTLALLPGPGAPALVQVPAAPLWAAAGPLPSAGTGLALPTPRHSGDGGGGARLQLPFVPRGMERPRPAVLPGWSRWVKGCVGPPLPGDPSSLSPWGGSREPSALGEAGPSKRSPCQQVFVCNPELARWLCGGEGRGQLALPRNPGRGLWEPIPPPMGSVWGPSPFSCPGDASEPVLEGGWV